jgi:hypothetical protein
MIEHKAWNLHKEFSTELQEPKHHLESTSWEFRVQLAAVEAQIRHKGGNAGATVDRVKPFKSYESVSWTVLHHQFEAITSHNESTSHKKVTHLLIILQRQASSNLCCVLATYEEIVGVLAGLLW